MAIEKVNTDALSDILERIIQHKGQDFITHNEMFLAMVNKMIQETLTHIIHDIHSEHEINKKTSIQ